MGPPPRATARWPRSPATTAHVGADAFARRARLARRGPGRATTRSPPSSGFPLDAHAAGEAQRLSGPGPTSAPDRAALRSGSKPTPLAGRDAVAVFQIRHVLFATWQTKLWRARVLAALGRGAVARFNREGSSAGDTPVIVPAGVREAVGELDAQRSGLRGGRRRACTLGWADGRQTRRTCGRRGSERIWVDQLGHVRRAAQPVIAGDPHRSYEVPNVYYQLRLSCAPQAGIEAAGFSFPGVPGIQHFGQNGDVAWGVTNAGADYQDLYVERLPGRDHRSA